jgi:hypothetical protein
MGKRDRAQGGEEDCDFRVVVSMVASSNRLHAVQGVKSLF